MAMILPAMIMTTISALLPLKKELEVLPCTPRSARGTGGRRFIIITIIIIYQHHCFTETIIIIIRLVPIIEPDIGRGGDHTALTCLKVGIVAIAILIIIIIHISKIVVVINALVGIITSFSS